MPLNYPIPLIRDLSFRLSSSHRYYSVLDLEEAFYSFPLTKRASERAAIITNQGVYKPLRTMFGLRNAPAKFCELIATNYYTGHGSLRILLFRRLYRV